MMLRVSTAALGEAVSAPVRCAPSERHTSARRSETGDSSQPYPVFQSCRKPFEIVQHRHQRSISRWATGLVIRISKVVVNGLRQRSSRASRRGGLDAFRACLAFESRGASPFVLRSSPPIFCWDFPSFAPWKRFGLHVFVRLTQRTLRAFVFRFAFLLLGSNLLADRVPLSSDKSLL